MSRVSMANPPSFPASIVNCDYLLYWMFFHCELWFWMMGKFDIRIFLEAVPAVPLVMEKQKIKAYLIEKEFK
ncbi:unnamed protein product [Sphenostylis stenocarpa]|uniref:Uncharacterized protein n=1 Tax=Sphenostylis stenocarpa TaxID=92480 RepID=A0AA86SBR4_9FABA|nr:unnamed protein product [Sphenostylis stenocarpa]